MTPEWTDDCMGKKDYDFPILHISSRYWPRGGGYFEVNKQGGKVEIKYDSTRPEVKPSAHCQLLLHVPGEEDDIQLLDCDFEANTEEEVKAAVEAFAKSQWEIAVKALKDAYYVDPNGSPN